MGPAGDPIVELAHLKQPAEPIGPFKVLHDHDHGTSSIVDQVDALQVLLRQPGPTPPPGPKAITGAITPHEHPTPITHRSRPKQHRTSNDHAHRSRQPRPRPITRTPLSKERVP
jgi:hypothetical protein